MSTSSIPSATSRPELRIGPEHRIFIAGQNRSGKSTLATEIANRWPRVLIYDPKVDAAAMIPNALVAYNADQALAGIPGRVIWRPAPGESRRRTELLDRLLERILVTGGSHGVVIHELRDFGESDRELGNNFDYTIRAGPGLHIPMALVTQRPYNVPTLAMSEARIFVCFRLEVRRDRERMAEFMGPEVLEMLPPDHSFWYRGLDGRLVHVAPLPVRPSTELGGSPGWVDGSTRPSTSEPSRSPR